MAADVGGSPWSCAAGMKWVPTRPFVDHPQMKNVTNSSQKARVLEASRRRIIATFAGPAPPSCSGGGSVQPGGAP